MSGDVPAGDGFEPAQVIDPERDQQIAELRSEIADQRSVNDELTDKMAQVMFENAKLNRGKKSSTRPPSTAVEAFSGLALVLLRRGVTEAQLSEDLAAAFRLYDIPNVTRQVQQTLALTKKRQAE